jgi:UDP-glucose 4-epimerase
MGDQHERRRLLVTGGCGFIGSHLVDGLLAMGHEVVVLDDLSTGNRKNLDPRAHLVVGDAADPKLTGRAFTGVAGCFHLAAIASVTGSNEDWLASHRANQTATISILNEARAKDGRPPVPVVYASSAAVYGEPEVEPLGEEASTQPLTAYGADKLGSELHARVAWTVHGVPTIGLRFFNVYGPRQDPSSPYSGVISIFVDRLRTGLPIAVHGDGTQVRDFIYVGDVVRHLMAAMDHCREGARVYNVCTGRPTAIGHLPQILGELLQVTPRIELAPRRAGDIARSVGSPARARRDFGIAHATPIREGLRSLLELA